MSKIQKEEAVMEQPKVVETVSKKQITPQWEIKDRRYYLLQNKEPLTYTLNSKNSSRHSLLYFDNVKGEQKELRYATKQNLQKLLSLYHPKKGIEYSEWQADVVANDELDDINIELDAMIAAKNMEIDHAEAVLRVELGSAVASLSSKELRRDLLLMARKNPSAFLAIASDENVGLRNIGIRAEEQRIIILAQDQRTFHWGSNNRKLMTIPFDENPYSALAAWFKTDEGVEVFKTIQKKLQ